MRQLMVGESALLLECDDDEDVEAWRAAVWRLRAAGSIAAVDIVPGARTILLDGVTYPVDLPRNPLDGPGRAEPALVEVPTVFDGEDLDGVAEQWGVSPVAAVERLAGVELLVAFCGFAPGFAYLRGLPAEWAVPRLAVPRARVPAGSVALAGGYAGIYPTASPGGWRLVGRTSVPLFDVRREPPALLIPGTRVRLVPL